MDDERRQKVAHALHSPGGWSPLRNAGTLDVWEDAVTLGVLSGVVTKAGSRYRVTTTDAEGVAAEIELGNGIDAASDFLRENPAWFNWVSSEAVAVLTKG